MSGRDLGAADVRAGVEPSTAMRLVVAVALLAAVDVAVFFAMPATSPEVAAYGLALLDLVLAFPVTFFVVRCARG